MSQVAARIEAEAFEPYTGWSTLPEEVHTILLRGQRAPQSLSRRDLLEFTPEQLTLLLKVHPPSVWPPSWSDFGAVLLS